MTRLDGVSRRTVLAGMGATGMLAGVGLAGSRITGSSPAYTDYTLAASHGPLIRVGWYSVYNGELISGSPIDGDEWTYNETGEYVDDVSAMLDEVDPSDPLRSGPAIEVDNLLPGDHGILSIGLLAEEDAEDDAEIWMRLQVTPSSGQLGDAIEAHIWYDDGFLGIGRCSGDPNSWGSTSIAQGSLNHVGSSGAMGDGVHLDPDVTENGCLAGGDERCLGFSWSLPTSVGNEVQGKSVSFSIDFVALYCENSTGNPFDGGD